MAKDQISEGQPKLKRKQYEKELRRLQAELCRLQDWVKLKGLRIIVVFEGRDGAGKGGTIKAITERVSPRVFRVVALPAPSDREKSQMYIQRYIEHFPAAGEIVLFDRSWYNRAGVEHVMRFCTKEQHRRFLEVCPEVEKFAVDAGVRLIKYWLEVSNKEQKRRFAEPYGLAVAEPLVRLFSRARRHAESYRYQVRAMAHSAFGRQEEGAPKLHLAHSECDSLRKSAPGKG
jgi:polyphosphate kinase 2 (PPK2 family)